MRIYLVSNPNGVNLHILEDLLSNQNTRFKPQRGKFTLPIVVAKKILTACFKPQRGKFTLATKDQQLAYAKAFQTPTG